MIRRLCDRIADGENLEDLMHFEWSRYVTFKTFPVVVPASPLRLAEAGFYYVGHGQSDEVRCFSCSIGHRGWKEDDFPFEIHKLLSPSCEFVRGTDGNNVPIHDPNSYRSTPASTERTSQNGVLAGEIINATQNAGNRVTNGMLPNTPYWPKFPRFITRTNRLDSFVNSGIKEDVTNIEKLAEAGFFYAGVGDCVRCFHCGLGLRNWEYGEDPWVEHAKYFPWCNYMLEQKGKEFICEHSDRDVIEAMEPNANAPSTTKVGEQTNGAISREGGQGAPEKSPKQRNSQRDGTGTVEDGEECKSMENLKKELGELKDKLMCKICWNSETNVVFLPCGHMISCQACAPHITKCAICRQHIDGRKKIFLP